MIARAGKHAEHDTAEVHVEPLKLVPVSTTTGVIAWLPQQTVESLKSNGGGELRIKIESDTSGWLTTTEAAQEYMTDRDGLKLKPARVRVARYADRGAFKSVGSGRERRIEPVSFRAWRLAERERDLNGMEAGR